MIQFKNYNKSQYKQQNQETNYGSIDDQSSHNSPYVVGTSHRSRNYIKQNSMTLSKILDSKRLSNSSIIQQSLSNLKTTRPQSGYSKKSIDQQSFSKLIQSDEWNYSEFKQTQKKDLYLDQIQLKAGCNQLQNDNLKLKSAIVKMDQKIGQLKRQMTDFKILEQYAQPLLKDQNSIPVSKQKQNEDYQTINYLKREIKMQKDLIDQKAFELEEMKKMLRTVDYNEVNLERKILADASIDFKQRFDKITLQNKVGILLYTNDFQQLEDIYHQKIKELQKQNIHFSSIYGKEQEEAQRIRKKHNDSNREVTLICNQIQDIDAEIKAAKEEIINNKQKKVKIEGSKASPQTPKDKLYLKQLDEEKQELVTEKQELEKEYNETTKRESQKQQAIESQKNSYLNAIDGKKEENQDILEQLQIIREQNKELIMRLKEEENINEENEEYFGDASKINQKRKDSNSLKKQDKSAQNKYPSMKLNENSRKDSINSQKSSDAESLQYTQSKYGGSAQQKVLSNYSPFQTTTQKNNLLSTLKNSQFDQGGVSEIYHEDQEIDIVQNQNDKNKHSFPIINIKQSSNHQGEQNNQRRSNEKFHLQNIPQNDPKFTPVTSKNLENFQSPMIQIQNKTTNDNINEYEQNNSGLDLIQNRNRLNTDTQSNRQQNKHLLGVKSGFNKNRRSSDCHGNQKSNQEDYYSDSQSSGQNTARQLSLFQRLNDSKRVRKISDVSSQYSMNDDSVVEDHSVASQQSRRENICYVDIERENFIDYLQKTIDLEKECEKFENLIENKELLSFPNPQNQLVNLQLSQSSYNFVNNIFGFDSNCFNYDVRKQRVKSSHVIQDLIIKYLEDQSTKKSFQIRAYEIHKISNEKKRFDHSMLLHVSLGLPHILKQISLNTIALPELANSSFEFVNQYQIGNKEAYKALIKRSMQSCTLISFPIDTSHQLEMILKEIELTSLIDSSYTLKPLCSYVDREDSKYYLNIIYVPLIGNLQEFLDKYEVQESDRIKICYQIALGIQDIHLQNYIHTQIKPDNILINENFVPLITNLRESSSLNEQKVEKESLSNSVRSDRKTIDKSNITYTYQWVLTKSNSWQQKNVFTNQDLSQKYDFSFDIFSLGLIIYYILTQKQIPVDFNENSTFDEIKYILEGLDSLPLDYQNIIRICLEKKTSIQGVLYSLRKLLDVSDLEDIYNTEQSLNLLAQEQKIEKQSETFFEKGRLISQIENGVVDGVGMLFRSNNINLKGNNLNFRNTEIEKKHEDMTTQMECLIGYFKGENLQGKSIFIKQNESFIQYMRSQNDKMIYIFDSNTDELISCKLHKQLPHIKGELEESFLDKLTDQNLQCTNHLVLPDKTELIRNPKNHTLILKKPGYGEIHYSPTNIKYYLPNDSFMMIENSKTYMYKSLSSSLNIVLPTSSSKEKIQLVSKEYFFEFINVNPFYILTLSKKNNEKQPITVIFDGNFQLNTFLPAENAIKISTIQVNGGYLGFIINVKQNTVIFGVFKSPNEQILLQGYKTSNKPSQYLQNVDISEQENENQSPLKSIKREFFSNNNNKK